MFESIFEDAQNTSSVSPAAAMLSLGCAIIIGIIISVAYMAVSRKEGYHKDFIIGLVLLPAIVSLVIMLIGSNVARAFSMAGAFALVRFRSAPGSAKDIAVVFLTMACGLGCGLGMVGYAATASVIIVLVLLVLSFAGFGNCKTATKQLKITIPENLNYNGVFEEIFAKYGVRATLRNIRTTNMGTLYELTYWVDGTECVDDKELIDDLRVRNGNLNISLGVIPERMQQGMLN